MIGRPRSRAARRGWLALAAATCLALAGLPATAAMDDVIVVRGECPDGQHESLAGGCACDDSRMIVLDQECVLDPGQLFLGPQVVDTCLLFGVTCPGGGGGGGGGDRPEPPEDENACVVREGGETTSCQDALSRCAERHQAQTTVCASPGSAAFERCAVGEWPPGTQCTPILRRPHVGSDGFGDGPIEAGLLECSLLGGGGTFVGTAGELLNVCQQLWFVAGATAEAQRGCREDADARLEACEADVEAQCEGCPGPPATVLAEAPATEPEPAPVLGWLRAKVATRGHTVLDAEAFVRDGSRSTCYWRVLGLGGLPAEATLHCPAGSDRWLAVGHLTFVALDARAYVATGTCGIATGDGAARGDASYLLRLRGEGSSLRRAKLVSTSGAIGGSLDGVHSYRGDCRLKGRGVEEGAVPASLRRALGVDAGA